LDGAISATDRLSSKRSAWDSAAAPLEKGDVADGYADHKRLEGCNGAFSQLAQRVLGIGEVRIYPIRKAPLTSRKPGCIAPAVLTAHTEVVRLGCLGDITMLRALAWIEIGVSPILLTLFVWPVSGFCFGRPLGQDCESWFIFGVNVFGPVGVLSLACGLWSLNTGSHVPHYVMLAGVALVLGYGAFSILLA
jgi:hypothetical protein